MLIVLYSTSFVSSSFLSPSSSPFKHSPTDREDSFFPFTVVVNLFSLFSAFSGGKFGAPFLFGVGPPGVSPRFG